MKNKVKIILLLIALALLTSCATVKKTKTDVTTKTEVTEKTKDSSTIISTSGKIDDTITVPVGSTGSHECDEELVKLLSKLNTTKTSGNNSYQLYYDSKLEAIIARLEVAETQDRETVINTDTNTQVSVVREIEDYIKKIVVPWWAYLLVVWVFRKPILSVLKGIVFLIFPASKGITSLADLLTPPNKE